MTQVNKSAQPARIDPGMLMMVGDFGQRSDTPKLDSKFVGPYRVLAHIKGYKYRVQHLDIGQVRVEHGDNLKELAYADGSGDDPDFLLPTSPLPPSFLPESGEGMVTRSYNLRPRS